MAVSSEVHGASGAAAAAAARGRRCWKGIAAALLAGLGVGVGGCTSTTVLLANFNGNTAGAPPAAAQSVGSVSLDPGAGTVTVVSAPASGLPNNTWVRIHHPTAPSPQTAMRGDFSRFDGVGSYSLLASLFIPSDSGIVTLQFEPFGAGPASYANFLHFDFMPEGDIRVNDGARFGRYPRDRAFVVSVRLNITETGASAAIRLFGQGTSGEREVTVQPNLLGLARRFGAVRFWMGFQSRGAFFVDDILVTRRN